MASHLPIYSNYEHQRRVFKDVLDCELPRVRTSIGFAFYGSVVWNSLPSALRDGSLSLNTFGRHLINPLNGSGGRWLHFEVFSAMHPGLIYIFKF